MKKYTYILLIYKYNANMYNIVHKYKLNMVNMLNIDDLVIILYYVF